MYSNKENINILTSLLVEYGVRDVVVCPGSRNAPLVHNFNECPDINCHPVTDERSAAFVALGITTAKPLPVAICVTSGSALLNTLPGVAEASYQKRGIIVISADRPLAWIDQLDGQTLPQQNALGAFVEESVSLPECKDDVERWHCRRLVCQAMLGLKRSGRSVHINVPLSEPLFEFTTEKLPVVKAVTTTDWNSVHRSDVFDIIRAAKRPMIVVGQTKGSVVNADETECLRNNFVVLNEQLSGSFPCPSLDAVIDNIGDARNEYKPDFLLYIGGNTVSKKLRLFLRELNDCEVMMVNREMHLEDPTMHATRVIVGCNGTVVSDIADICRKKKLCESADKEFLQRWDDIIAMTRQQLLTEPERLDEMAVKMFEDMLCQDAMVFYANSSSIRWAAKYAQHRVFCNRGLNGIEGSVSTAAGASLVCRGKVFCVTGDLSFFYDQNALWNTAISGNLRILLLNNGGGQIFNTLKGLEQSAAKQEYVMAAHNTTAEGACLEHGIAHRVATTKEELCEAIEWLIQEPSHRPMVLEVMVDLPK